LYLGCWFTATTPVLGARADLAAAEQAWFEDGRIDKAERAYKHAAEVDPLNAEPCEWLARLFLQRWQATGEGENELFDMSVYWQRQALLRQPRQIGAYRALGAAYLARFQRTRDPEDAVLAADEFARAAALYPNHAELQSELAEALSLAEEPDAARSFAERALDLDAINRRLGHRDKILPESRQTLLENILKPQPALPERLEEPGEN
jgi:tetratricopeptide (TPR) repeat protein